MPTRTGWLAIVTVIVFILLWGTLGFLAIFGGTGIASSLNALMGDIFLGALGLLGLDLALLGKTGKRQLEFVWFSVITLMGIIIAIAMIYIGLVIIGWLLGTGFFTAQIALLVDGIRRKIEKPLDHLVLLFSNKEGPTNPSRPYYLVNNEKRMAYWAGDSHLQLSKQGKIEWASFNGQAELTHYFTTEGIKLNERYPMKDELD